MPNWLNLGAQISKRCGRPKWYLTTLRDPEIAATPRAVADDSASKELIIAASEASVAICSSNSVEVEFAEREARATEWRSMRVTVSHNRRKEEITQSVDRSFDDLFKGFGTVPIQIVNESRKWTGSRMNFSFDAKVGIVSTPIKGFVDVTDKEITVDADLGWLERLFPAKQTQATLEQRVKGLLT
jgi:hypothetical protein